MHDQCRVGHVDIKGDGSKPSCSLEVLAVRLNPPESEECELA